MGWALQRSDGTYRAWCRQAKDEPRQNGETWVELKEAPVIGLPKDWVDPAAKKTTDRATALQQVAEMEKDEAIPKKVRDVVAALAKVI